MATDGRHLRMIGGQGLLEDREGAPEERLGLSEAAGSLVRLGLSEAAGSLV